MKYDITFARYGYATIDAVSKEDAFAKAEALGAGDVEWSDEFNVTDVEETDPFGTMGFE